MNLSTIEQGEEMYKDLSGYYSTCCHEPVSIGGDEGATRFFVCTACQTSCNATSSYTVSTAPVKVGKVNWFQRLMRKIFRLQA